MPLEGELKEAQKELDFLGGFKADLRSFTRYYEFMSQIVDYDSTDLEKLSLYARHLYPLLRKSTPTTIRSTSLPWSSATTA